MIYLDTETIGLTGPVATIQYSRDEEAVSTHHVWLAPISDTLDLIDSFTRDTVCAFNLVFDWFHLQRLRSILWTMQEAGASGIPQPGGYIACERKAVFAPCIKPPNAIDLMLHARKGPLQSLMQRDDARVKMVPIQLAEPLAQILEERFNPGVIYFAKRATGCKWIVEVDEDDPNWADLVLRFGAAGDLK